MMRNRKSNSLALLKSNLGFFNGYQLTAFQTYLHLLILFIINKKEIEK